MNSGGASPLPTEMPQASAAAGPSGLSQVTTAADGTVPVPKTKICVYCGASSGKNLVYLQAARDLAKVMADNNIGLVYGGGTIGLMGELAKTLVALAGPDAVHGIIPEALVRYERDPTYTATHGDSDLALPSVEVYGKTTVVKDMHTRKRMMAEEVLAAGPGSGFVAMSGGYGTFEELLETCTWSQLGIHTKGVCVLNINGFYDGLFAWIRTAVNEGFISEGNATIIAEAKTPADTILALQDYKLAPSVLKLSWGSE